MLIICILTMITGFVGLYYFQYQYPNSEIYNVTFESQGYTIDATVYEPRVGPAGQESSSYRPLVILIHGFAMSKEFMLSIGIELASRGVSSLSFSMPGHGFSEGPYCFTNASPYIVSDAIDYMISNAIYDINTTCLGVIGHSMGAMTAIKAASLDPRIISTVAMAAPNGDSKRLATNEQANLYFNEFNVSSYTNLTSPKNLLFVLGQLDELVSLSDGQKIMSVACGVSIENLETDTLYNPDFKAGTSRMFKYYSWMDHLTEVYDPRSVSEVINWTGVSFGFNSASFMGANPIVSHWRPILIAIGIIGAFILTIPLSSILYPIWFIKKTEKTQTEKTKTGKTQTESDLKDTDREYEKSKISKFLIFVLKITLLYSILVGIIPGLIGYIFKLKWPIGGSILSDAPYPMFFLGSVFGFLFLLINQKFKIIDTKITFSRDLFSIPPIKTDKSNFKGSAVIKYIVYFLASFLPAVLFTQILTSSGILNIFIAPHRIPSFVLCLLMILPLCLLNSIMIRVPIFMELEKLFHKRNPKNWIGRIIFSLITAGITGLSCSIAFVIGIPPIMAIGFADAFIMWFVIYFAIFFMIDFVHANWVYFVDESIFATTLIPAVIFAILANVAFPVSIIY
jgi:pimeloyl-ACP methyl ester carboxylesterase